MNVSVVKANQLSAAHLSAWSHLQQADASLCSPYFRPEFTQAVAAVRNDVEVAVLSQHGEPVGFFPYQRGKRNIGTPVGGRLSDFHGAILRKDLALDAAGLIRDCGLSAWHFDHLIASQRPFRDYHWVTTDSPCLDLSRGFEAYSSDRQKSGSRTIGKMRRKARKLAREVGPLHFEPHLADKRVFDTLIDWKIKQYQHANVFNCLSLDWTVPLLEHVLGQRSRAFSGMLSALYAGDRLAAVELGILSHHVYHCWFPAYDPDLQKHSPGMLRMIEFAKASPALGITRIDLGKGPEAYKQSLASGAIPLAEGSVDLRPIAGVFRQGLVRTRQWIRTSPLEVPAQRIMRTVRALRNVV